LLLLLNILNRILYYEPLVAAASVIAAGLSVGLAAIGLEWDKELLLVTL
jgi:hypothetical protein